MEIFLVVLMAPRFYGDGLIYYLYLNTSYFSDFSYSSLSNTPHNSAIFYCFMTEIESHHYF